MTKFRTKTKTLRLLGEEVYIDEDMRADSGLWVLETLHRRFAKRATAVWQGRNRTVFDRGPHVVKIPRNFDGIADNDWEGSISNGSNLEDPDYVQYARTRLVMWEDVPIVLMEKVRYASLAETMAHLGTQPGESDWTWSVDGGQVGFTRRGRLVAFDYGVR